MPIWKENIILQQSLDCHGKNHFLLIFISVKFLFWIIYLKISVCKKFSEPSLLYLKRQFNTPQCEVDWALGLMQKTNL